MGDAVSCIRQSCDVAFEVVLVGEVLVGRHRGPRSELLGDQGAEPAHVRIIRVGRLYGDVVRFRGKGITGLTEGGIV